MDNETLPTQAETATVKRGLGRRVWEFPVTRILAFLLLFAALCPAVAVPLVPVFLIAHIPFDPSGEVAALVAEGVSATAALGAFLLMVRYADRRPVVSAGLGRQGLARETGLGLLLGGGLFSLVIAAMALLGAFHVRGTNAHFQPLVPLFLFLAVAVTEETIFRGYIYQTLEIRWGSGVALAGSGAAFGLVHLLNPVAGVTPAERLAGPVFLVFEASILMTAGYLLTRRLWLPIGIHWGWNFFESAVYGTTDSGLPAGPIYSLLRSHVSGLFTLTGGPFGPEASAVCLVISTAAGLLLLRAAIQRGQWRPRRLSPHLERSTLEVIR